MSKIPIPLRFWLTIVALLVTAFAAARARADDVDIDAIDGLIAKHPEAAVPAIKNALGKADDPDVRQALVCRAAQIPGDAPLKFLSEELKSGRSLDERVAAAWGLRERNRSEAVPAMIAEWKAAKPGQDRESLVEFLAGSDNVEAIHALAAGLAKRVSADRFAVVWNLSNNLRNSVIRPRILGPGQMPPATPPPKGWTDNAIRLLINSLDDTDDDFFEWGSTTGPSCANARVCDTSAYGLNQFDSKRFPFDISGTWAQRDRSLALLKNELRKQQGLPPLPVPEPRKPPIALVPLEKLKPLLDRLQRAPPPRSEHTPANTPISIAAATSAEIEALGAGAFAETLKRMNSLAPNSPQRPVFDRLARRLASTVVDMQFGERSLKPDGTVKAQFENFKGKPFNAQAIADAIDRLATHLCPPAFGFKFFVFRAAGEAGTTLRLDIIDRQRAIALGRSVERIPRVKNESPGFDISAYADIHSFPQEGMSFGWNTTDLSLATAKLLLVPEASPNEMVYVGIEVFQDAPP